MCLTVLHKVGVVPSHQVAEKKEQPQNPPDDTAAVVGGPKIGIYVPYLDQLKSYLHPSEGLLVVWLAITHPCLHL